MHNTIDFQLHQRTFDNHKLPVVVPGDHWITYPTVAVFGDDFFFVFCAFSLLHEWPRVSTSVNECPRVFTDDYVWYDPKRDTKEKRERETAMEKDKEKEVCMRYENLTGISLRI